VNSEKRKKKKEKRKKKKENLGSTLLPKSFLLNDMIDFF